MKKGLLTLAAGLLLTAGSTFAQDYYLIGGFNNWQLAQADCKFTAGSNGEYTLDYAGTLTSGFKINDGTWANDAANWGGGGQLTIGEVYTLVVGGSSSNITMGENVENPHIVFNPTANTLLITGQQVEAEYGYAIHGSFVPAWETKNMTNNNGVWTLTAQVDGKLDFGVKKYDMSSGAQVDWISSAGDGSVTLNTAMPCMVEGTNWAMTGTGEFTFKFNPTAMTLTIEGEGGDTPNPPTPPIGGDFADLYLVGTVTGWVKDEAYKMTTTDGVTYTITTDLLPEDEFKFYDGDWNSINLGLQAEQLTLADGTYDLVSGNESKNLGLGVGGHVTLTLVQSDNFASAKLTISGQSGEYEYPSSIYVIGNVNDLGWAPNNVVELPSISNGVYEGEVTFTSDIELAYFSFCEKAGATDDWETEDLGTRWAATENDLEVAAGSTYGLQSSNENAAFCIPVGNYKVRVNLPEQNVSFAVGTGVAEIEAANGEAVYFNLQGMRVANPENGLFIKVINGKSTKVLLNK